MLGENAMFLSIQIDLMNNFYFCFNVAALRMAIDIDIEYC